MKRSKNKMNRYGRALGIPLIAGKVFKEKAKKYAYADSWGKPETFLKDWEVVTKRKPPG